MAYAPYGEDYADSGTSDLNFTGQNQDTVSGLYDFLYREYSPSAGRWIQPDPAGMGAVSMANPQTWNRYAYVMNNPVISTDPLGLWRSDVFGSAKSGGADAMRDLGGAWFNAQIQEYLHQAGLDSPIQQALYSYVSGIPGYRVQGGELYWHVGFSTPNPKFDPEEPGSVAIIETVKDFDLGPIGGAANNGSFWSYLASKPWVVSWILPVVGPTPGVIGVGPAGSVAWNPKTHNLCIGFGLGASAGHNAAIGPLLFGSGNVDSVLSGWSVSGGGNLPFPAPTAGLGWQAIANTSGIAHGPTAGVVGLSISVTWSKCANLW